MIIIINCKTHFFYLVFDPDFQVLLDNNNVRIDECGDEIKDSNGISINNKITIL